MFKKSIFLLLCLALVVMGLVACGDDVPDTTHTHAYATEWSCDENSHWYAATCEHTDLKANLAAHVDAGNDGVCDICNYGNDHTHTYATDWTSDETDHWYKSTCGHTVVSDKAAHVDANNDGVCEVCNYGVDHQHTYATEWSSDETNHWYAASCGHSVEGYGKVAHTDTNNDGACDVCGYNGGHTHAYATGWTTSESKHWHAPTCGHSVLADEAAHVDADNDGACDVCKYDAGHEHAYAATWSFDSTAHWNAASCGHAVAGINKANHADTNGDHACDVCGYSEHSHAFNRTTWIFDGNMHWHVATCGCSLKADEAAHIDVNDDGKCDVCPWVSSIEVALVIGSAEASKNQVAGGTVTQEGPYSASRVTYVYGSDYVYIKSDTRYTEYDSLYNVVGYYWETDSEEWYTVIDGELLALQDNYAGFHKNDWPEAGYMNGPYLNLVQYSVNVYGVENALIALYNLAVETEGDDLAVTYDYTSNTWTFSFNYIDGYEDWWSGEYTVSTVGVVNVSFIVDAQGVIDYVKIEERYYDSYEQTEDGVWVGIASDDDNIYTTVINQVLGGRVTSFPFNMDDFYVTDIKFIDSEGKELGDELTTDIGVYNEFTVTVVAPESANLSIDVPEVTVYDAYGNVTYNARAGYSSWDGTVFYFTVYREGTYTVEFKTAKTTKTVTVTAVVPAPTYIEPSVVGKDDWGDNTFIVTSTVTGYVGKPVYFMASANEYADASYTVMLSRPALMAGCTVGTETVEVSYTLYEVSAFLAQYPGSYEVLLTSAVDPSLTAVLTIEIVEPPKPSDILNGSYADTWRMNSLVFTPAFEGATEGTVEAVVAPDYWTSYSIVYSYVYNNDGTITLTYVSGDLADVSIVINDDYTVSLGVYNEWWMEYSYTTLEKIETSGSGADVVDGYWYDEGYSYGIIAFFDSETSTGSFTYGDSVLAFTFSVEEVYGVYYITFTEDAANHVNPETLQGLLDFDVMNGNNAWYQPSVYNPYSEYLEIMYVHPMNGYLSTMYFVAA